MATHKRFGLFLSVWWFLAGYLVAGPLVQDNPALPGAQHEWLASFAGKWSQDIKFWSAPGSEPMQYRAEAENTVILGGRYLQSKSHGDMGGLAVSSLNVFGFDRRRDRFTVVGFDTLGTYSVMAEGEFAEDQKRIVLKGETKDPKNGTTQAFEFVLHKKSADIYVFEVIFQIPGMADGFRVAEITYTRKT